jgi:Tfp pilus assembly PilM family ATPase
VRLEIDQSADEAALVEVRATACDHEPYAEALEQLSSVEAREAIQHQAVKAFLSRWDLKGARVGVGFPGSATLGRFFQLPPLFSSKLAEIVEYEARGRIPLPLESLAWGSHVFGAAAASGDELMCRRAAIIAARQDQVREHLGPLEQSDLEIHLVTSDGAALFNIAARELLDGRYPDDLDPDDAEATIAMLDVGAEHTNLVVAGRTTTWFRSISRGGLHAVRQIARELNVTHDRAHAILVEPTKSPRLYRVEQAMAPLLDDLYAEVVRSLTTFHNDHPGYQVKRLYGVGGAFLMHGLWKRLR